MNARHSLLAGARDLGLVLTLAALPLAATAHEVADLATAKAKAAAAGKTILIDFSAPT